MNNILVATIAFGYLILLFGIAYFGDRRRAQGRSLIANPYIYTLSLAVYCTSWTFYGSVGKAANEGLTFLPIYFGPSLIAFLWWIILRKLIRLCKENHITTLADFLTLRFGRGALLGAVVTLWIIIADMPYIGLQLKAISTTFDILVGQPPPSPAQIPFYGDKAFYVALILAAFGFMFGARHLDANERHEGLVAAIAFESLVKLVAFLAIGILVSYFLFPGIGEIFQRIQQHPEFSSLFLLNTAPHNSFVLMLVETILAMAAIMLLPRQFHMAIVENTDERHLLTAGWLLPLYLFLINFFVLPLAFGGLLLGHPASQGDFFVLSIPLSSGHNFLALLAFLGGLSAATAMVMVASITLSTMLLNSLLMPFLARFWGDRDWSGALLHFKRLGILLILMLGYLSYRTLGPSTMLVEMGLIAFAGVMQLVPALLAALYWQQATRRGALAGLTLGFLCWAYTLLLPYLVQAGWFPHQILDIGPWGLNFLRPTALLGLDGLHPLVHSFCWSMLLNVGVFVSVSLLDRRSPQEVEQAQRFVRSSDSTREVSLEPRLTYVADPDQLISLAAKFIGMGKAQEILEQFIVDNQLAEKTAWTEADKLKLQYFVERLIGGSIGPAAAKVVVDGYLATLGSRMEGVFDLFGEVSHSLEESREALRSRVAELSILYEAAQHSTSSLSLPQILESILNLIDEKFNIEQCSVRLLDEDGVLRLKSFRGPVPPEPSKMDLIPDMTTLIGQCLLTRSVISIPDVAELPATTDTGLSLAEILNSFILVPLATESQVMGVLSATSRLKGFCPPEHLDFFRSLANQVSLAIHNAQLYGKITRFSKELETKVAERTLELKNKSIELAEANRALKELDRLKTDFLANISHELRTPLNSILGYTELLLDGVDGPLNLEQKNSLQRVEKASRRLLQLINDVLDLSKLRAGKIELNQEIVSLHDIVIDALNIIEPLARNKEIEVKVEESELPPLLVDRDKIIQVLLNLLSNAVKFTGPQGLITVSTYRQSLPEAPGVVKDYAAIQVKDTGIGIKEEDLKNIFQEFVQINSSATRLQGGTGLGLPISRRLVELHKGRLWVESEFGRGSSFTFILPLEPASPLAPAAIEKAVLMGRLVLGITRRRELIELLQKCLTPLGFTFQAVAMVDNVLAIMPTERPHVIVVDLLDRHSQPLEDIRRLRAGSQSRDLPLLPLALTEDGRSGLILGPMEFLNQPSVPEEFNRSLKNLSSWIVYKEALIIDRDREVCSLWVTLLKEEGFETSSVASGEEAIRHLENVLPGLVVIDLELKAAEVVRVLEFVRSQMETLIVPLLCLLPRHLEADQQHALQEQLRRSLNTKKFPLTHFEQNLKRYFSQIAAGSL